MSGDLLYEGGRRAAGQCAPAPDLDHNRARRRGRRRSARVAPHLPHRRPPHQLHLFGDAEAMPRVEGDVALLRGLEEGADAVTVALLEHTTEHGGAEPLALRGRIGAE